MKLTTKQNKVIGLAVLTGFLGCVAIVGQGSMVYSARNQTVTISEDIKTDEEKKFFSDSIQPRWFVYGSPIYYANEDYSLVTLDPKYKKYNTNSSIVAEQAINTEVYFLFASDSTGSEVKLKPVEADNAWTNENAENSVTIKFKHEIPLWTNLYFANDTRKLKDVKGGLTVSGSSTKVGTGKIMYRTVDLSASSFEGVKWDYKDLKDGAELSFTSPMHIQIAVMYEIREEGNNIFQKTWHHCVANYNLSVMTK